MNRSLQIIGAGVTNAIVLSGLGLAAGHISWMSIVLAALHAAAECGSQEAIDRASLGDTLLFGVSGLLLLALYTQAVTGTEPFNWAAGGLWAIGIALRVVAMRTLGAAFRSSTEAGSTWIEHGIYRHLHHPSEVGLMLCVAGAAWVANTEFAYATALMCAFLAAFRVHAEESALAT